MQRISPLAEALRASTPLNRGEGGRTPPSTPTSHRDGYTTPTNQATKPRCDSPLGTDLSPIDSIPTPSVYFEIANSPTKILALAHTNPTLLPKHSIGGMFIDAAARNEPHQTALWLAVHLGLTEEVEALLKLKPSINLFNPEKEPLIFESLKLLHQSMKHPPFHMHRYYDFQKSYLTPSFHPEGYNDLERSLFAFLIELEKEECWNTLSTKITNVTNAPAKKRQDIFFEIFNKLFSSVAYPKVIVDRTGHNLLHAAVQLNFQNIIPFLLDRGIGINSQVTSTGETALHLAIHLEDKELIQYLSSLGAQWNIRNRIGITPQNLNDLKNHHKSIDDELSTDSGEEDDEIAKIYGGMIDKMD